MNAAPSSTSNDNNGSHAIDADHGSRRHNRVSLQLVVTDPDVCSELYALDSEDERNCYALAALRIGVYAMRQASGVIDAATVRDEGARIVQSLRDILVDHTTRFTGDITGSLKGYFDPESGQLSQRLNRLIKRDGELDELMHRHLGDEASTVAQTLAFHVGENSPLFRLLSPEQADGLIASLREVIQAAMRSQRDQIVQNFSLDDRSSALSRLLSEVTDANGSLRKGLADDVAEVRKEFSLDNQDGALSRLVKRVEAAQAQISDQFSQDNADSAMSRMARLLETVNGTVKSSLTLDDDNSPLSLLRRQLMEVITQIEKSNGQFHTEIRETVAALKARKLEKARSTRHGDDFQEALAEFVEADARNRGDVFENATSKVGRIPRAKVGDLVVTMGPDSSAAGGAIVIEAKQEQGYDLKAVLAEIGQARTNRDAAVGIFVWSTLVAPEGVEPLARYGNDIVVIWDAEDPMTDVVLNAALSLARGLITGQSAASKERTADLVELDKAMQQIAKDASSLGEIVTWSTTVENNGNKIRTKAERLKQDLENQVERLNENLGRLRAEPTMGA